MKYQAMIQQILQAIGGEDNIQSVVHCATRLRFVLKDENKADDQKAESISGILQVVKKGGQYQLVIGNNVDEVYNELISMIKLKPAEGTKQTGGHLFDKIIGAITGSIAPAIPLLAGAGMGKVLLLILTITNVLSDKSQTYQLLNLIFDTGYYFIPAYVGFSAAKIFNTDSMLGAFIGLVTVNPNWVQIVTANKPFKFFGIQVPLIQYSSTLITAILSVWIMSYIYQWVKKITPGMIKVFMEPMLTMLITAPLVFLIIGPLSNWISQGIAFISMWLFHHAGFIAIPILAAAYPWLVSVGIHKALSPISIQLVAEQGFDPIIRVVALCSNISQASAALAVGLKSKDQKLKSLALSSSATAFLGGITEPALFGVNLKLKKPMYGAMIGGAVAGLVASFLKLKAYIYVTPAILSLPMWVSKTENFVIQAIIVMIVATIVTFIATWLIGFDDPADEKTKSQEKQNDAVNKSSEHALNAPAYGRIEDLSK
ncbi:MAG: PTS transporter subunit EIIC, partial [Lactobacillus sp.]|nr:PTS transporter subunit EIIC [Lactobacillus sp.]